MWFQSQTDPDPLYRTADGFLNDISHSPRDIVMVHLLPIEIGLEFHNQLLPELIQIIRHKLRNRSANEFFRHGEIIGKINENEVISTLLKEIHKIIEEK